MAPPSGGRSGGSQARPDRPGTGPDTGTRFRVRAARGDAARGLEVLDGLDRRHREGGDRAPPSPGLSRKREGGR